MLNLNIIIFCLNTPQGNLQSRDLMNITQNRLKTRHILEGRGETACLPKLMSPGVNGEKWMGNGASHNQHSRHVE